MAADRVTRWQKLPGGHEQFADTKGPSDNSQLEWWPRGEELLISLPGSGATLLPISLIYGQRIRSSSIAWGISEIYFELT